MCVVQQNELNINDLIAKIGAQKGSFNQRVFSALGDRIVDPKSIKFDSNKIKFVGTSATKQDVVALMVELDHK